MRHPGLLVFIVATGLFALGVALLPPAVAVWVALAAVAGLFIAFLVLIASGRWSPFVAWVLAGLLVLGLGGMIGQTLVAFFDNAVRSLAGMEFEHPWALLLLLALIPLLFVLGARNLGFLDIPPGERSKLTALTVSSSLMPPVGVPLLVLFLRKLSGRVPGLARRWIGVGLRSLIVVALVLALAEPRLAVPHDRMTVLFVLDRSLSVPEETAGNSRDDLRWRRVRDF